MFKSIMKLALEIFTFFGLLAFGTVMVTHILG